MMKYKTILKLNKLLFKLEESTSESETFTTDTEDEIYDECTIPIPEESFTSDVGSADEAPPPYRLCRTYASYGWSSTTSARADEPDGS